MSKTSPEPAQSPAPQKALTLAAVMGCVCVVGIALGLSLPLLALTMDRMGVSSAIIGWNTGTSALGTLLVAPLTPVLLRRFGTLPTLWTGFVLTAGCLLLFKAIENVWVWFPLRIFFVGSVSAIFVVAEIWIVRLAGDRHRGRIISVYGMILALGFTIGPALLIVVGSEGWLPYAAGAVLTLCAAVPLLFTSATPLVFTQTVPLSLRQVIRRHRTSVCGGFAFGAAEAGIFSLIVIYGLRNGLSEHAATSLVVAASIGNILLSVPFGLLADRLHNKQVLLGMLTVATILFALLLPLAIHSRIFALLVLFLAGGTIVAIYNTSLVLAAGQAKSDDLASVNAAIVFFYGLGSLIGPIFIGTSMKLWPPHGFVAALATALALYLLVLLLPDSQSNRPATLND